MADKLFKAFERRMGKLFGVARRGPIFRSKDGGTDDLTHPYWAVECKILSRPCFADLLAACRQAEAAAKPLAFVLDARDGSMCGAGALPERHPIAIVKKKGALDDDALVIQRLATFKAWHL